MRRITYSQTVHVFGRNFSCVRDEERFRCGEKVWLELGSSSSTLARGGSLAGNRNRGQCSRHKFLRCWKPYCAARNAQRRREENGGRVYNQVGILVSFALRIASVHLYSSMRTSVTRSRSFLRYIAGRPIWDR